MRKYLRPLYVPAMERYAFAKLYWSALRNSKPLTANDGFGTIFLSTYPKRFQSCVIAVDALSAGEILPKRITIFLTREECTFTENNLPKDLEALKRRGVHFHFLERNFRVYNKLPICHSGDYIYSIDRDQSVDLHPIITIDDDKITPPTFLRGMANGFRQYPELVQSYVCQTIEFTNQLGQSQIRLTKTDSDSPELMQLTNGLGGVLYPRNAIISIKRRGMDFLSVAPTNDDIWFRFCNIADGILCRQLLARSARFPQTPRTQRDGINSINFSRTPDGQVVNDKYFYNCLEYFGLQHLARQ